jgi:hypothetical protein
METQEMNGISELDIGSLGIGEDKPAVEAKDVLVMNYKSEPVKDKSQAYLGDKLVLMVKHPDLNDRILEISSVRFQVDDKIKTTGLWLKLDDEKKLPPRSSVARMLKFLNKASINELKGLNLQTVVQENGYLAIKAY